MPNPWYNRLILRHFPCRATATADDCILFDLFAYFVGFGMVSPSVDHPPVAC